MKHSKYLWDPYVMKEIPSQDIFFIHGNIYGKS